MATLKRSTRARSVAVVVKEIREKAFLVNILVLSSRWILKLKLMLGEQDQRGILHWKRQAAEGVGILDWKRQTKRSRSPGFGPETADKAE